MAEQKGGNAKPAVEVKVKTPSTKVDIPRQNQTSSEIDVPYTELNSLLSEKLGITADKLINLQTKKNPKELYSFLKDIQTAGLDRPRDLNGKFASKGTLAPNQPIAPISPDKSRWEDKLPGIKEGKIVMDRDDFSIKLRIDPVKAFKPKK